MFKLRLKGANRNIDRTLMAPQDAQRLVAILNVHESLSVAAYGTVEVVLTCAIFLEFVWNLGPQ